MKSLILAFLLISTHSFAEETPPGSPAQPEAVNQPSEAENPAPQPAHTAVDASPATVNSSVTADIEISGEDPLKAVKERRLEQIAKQIRKELEKEMSKIDKKYKGKGAKIASFETDKLLIKFEAKKQIRIRKEWCKKYQEHCNEETAIKDHETRQLAEAEGRYSEMKKKDTLDLWALQKECYKTKAQEPCEKWKKDIKTFEDEHQDKHTPNPAFYLGDILNSGHDSKKCEWAFDLPRRVVSAPGCPPGKASQQKACVGYVVCENPFTGLKMVRMSTCSPKNCSDDSAKSCTKEGGFSSEHKGEHFDGVSKKVEDLLGVTEFNENAEANR